jgi:predicted DNA-binding protein
MTVRVDLTSMAKRIVAPASARAHDGGVAGRLEKERIFNLTSELDERLCEFAVERGWSVAAAIRYFIEHGLNDAEAARIAPANTVRLVPGDQAVLSPASPESAVAMRELAFGVAFWRKRAWPADFHNADYQKRARQNPWEFHPELVAQPPTAETAGVDCHARSHACGSDCALSRNMLQLSALHGRRHAVRTSSRTSRQSPGPKSRRFRLRLRLSNRRRPTRLFSPPSSVTSCCREPSCCGQRRARQSMADLRGLLQTHTG